MFKWISTSVAQLDRFDTVGNGWREGEGDRERESVGEPVGFVTTLTQGYTYS